KQALELISSLTISFLITTNNFSAFKPRTLFIAVAENESLNMLKKASDQSFRHSDYKMKIENWPFHPHITIATRDLHKKDFVEAWPMFEGKIFLEEFEASRLSLLRHNGRHWDVVYTSAFAQQRAD
ncbi:MAG: hypothetical protein EON98_08095, partial [Chitinophagaceae bacterium]